jgi:hypothetical protein
MMRRGHVSETDLAKALLTGDQPRHLDRCDLCADRAAEMGRWLDEVKAVADAEVDAAFPAERVAAQHAQIMRRLEQADEPARVLEFPRQSARVARETHGRRVAPAWVGVAAAAGLVVGMISGQMTARHEQPAATPEATASALDVPAAPAAPTASTTPATPTSLSGPRHEGPSLLDMDLEGYTPDTLRVFDEATPRLIASRYTTVALR